MARTLGLGLIVALLTTLGARAQGPLEFPAALSSDSLPSPAPSDALPSQMEPLPVNPPAANNAGDVEFYTLDELKAEMKRVAWTRGDYTFAPYGILWVNMEVETGRTSPGNFPFYVQRPRASGNDNTFIDARSSRLGLDLLGPRIAFFDNAQSGGKVEIDFQRTIDVENKAGVLLRHAYFEIKNDEFRLLAGQTWDVVSPLCPGVLFYSVGWEAGNIGWRRPQLRGERYLAASDNLMFIAQGSLNTNLVTDTSFPGGSALSGGWPLLEGRLAMRVGPRGQGCQPWEFGVSSHIGELVYDFRQNTPAPGSANATSPFAATNPGTHCPTWSLSADMRVPLTPSFGVQGELFMGDNLGPFLGGVGQCVDLYGVWNGTTLLQAASGRTIRSRGGWVDVWYDWNPRLHSHAGYSIDDPFDADVTSGRIYNAFFFSNVSFDVTPKFLVGFEYSSWRTLWSGPDANATSQNYNCVMKYSF